jgi:hypothetical protein
MKCDDFCQIAFGALNNSQLQNISSHKVVSDFPYFFPPSSVSFKCCLTVPRRLSKGLGIFVRHGLGVGIERRYEAHSQVSGGRARVARLVTFWWHGSADNPRQLLGACGVSQSGPSHMAQLLLLAVLLLRRNTDIDRNARRNLQLLCQIRRDSS